MAAASSRRAQDAEGSHRSTLQRESLGAVHIPPGALYGIQTARSVDNLSFSGRKLGDYPSLVRALIAVKLATCRANRDARVLDAARSRAIESTCKRLIRGDYANQFIADLLGGGGWIGVNMNVNEVIAGLANSGRDNRDLIDPKLHVNASQSTADVCHTAARIAILEMWSELGAALKACIAVYNAKSRQMRRVMTMARTCLMDAMPSSLGALLGGHCAALSRRTAELERAVGALARVNLGGTVIGSGEGAPPTYRRRIIKRLNETAGPGLVLREDLYDAAQNIDDLAAVAAQLGLLAEVLIKIAQDLRLLGSGPKAGFGEIVLPAVQEGSSFFKGKINPVIPETLIQCGFQVLGCERAARLALERGELNLNVFESAAVVNIFDAIEMLQRSIVLFTERCLRGMAANPDRCASLPVHGRARLHKR